MADGCACRTRYRRDRARYAHEYSGRADWGMYQKPGDLEKMENVFLKNYYGRFIINKAGHWVQQEQPDKTFEIILKFLKKL